MEDQVPPEPLSIHCGEDHELKVFLARGILADGRALIRHSYVELLEDAAQKDSTRKNLPYDRELGRKDSKKTETKVENLTKVFFSDLLEAKGETLPSQKVEGDSIDSTVLELLEDTYSNTKQKAQQLLKNFEFKNPQRFKSLSNHKSNAVEEVRDLIRFFFQHITGLTQREDLSKRNRQRVALFHVAIALESLLGHQTTNLLLNRALEPPT